MRDITELMNHYREVARSVWNTGFWSVPDLQDWDSRDRFEEIKKLLFCALVIARIEQDGSCCKDLAHANYLYRVVPHDPGTVPIMIECPREGDDNRYWDDPVKEVTASDIEMEFLDYFDWNEMGYADFQYYKVRISAFTLQPHLVGREALVAHRHANVFAAPR